MSSFAPTREAALASIAAVHPANYARSRNAIDGAVSRLSPYITHGIVSLPEVLSVVAARFPLTVQHKFVFELGWREYFHHVWQQQGDGILQSLHQGPLPDESYCSDLPLDIRQGKTGVPVVDQAVRTLYATGYLHNHARMWLASYVVHLRKVHWRAGADWLIAHLLDGDLASNHLSWQWVAGTGSHKPYLFNAENVARYAPPAWYSEGTVIDTSYEVLDTLARGARPAHKPRLGTGVSGDVVEEPALSTTPPVITAPNPDDLNARDVWLVHPWALGEPPLDLPKNCLYLAWWPAAFHRAWPWSAARWSFVHQRMLAIAPSGWVSTTSELEKALASARSVQTVANPHINALLPRCVTPRPPMRLFAEVDRPCASFSTWWNRSTRGVTKLIELPGLAARSEFQRDGQLF